MSAPRAVLMELEGVLVETYDARRTALLRALADDGISISALDYDDVAHGLPVRGAVRAAIASAEEHMDETGVELVALRAERYFAESAATGVMLTDGARDALAALHAVARLGLVTRAARREVEPVLDAADASFIFECIVTADDVPDRPKPDPASYLSAVGRLERRRAILPREAIALEDARSGIRSARGAGLRCLAVGSVPAFRALDADGYLPTLRGATLESLDAAGGGEGRG
ncbi:MAG: HAD family phosphatase [Gemmatimonadaceae bacterium]|nr:HAD family phosphatase [Gemmatimonadaceae bacterium]NUQ91764.1 HAD family phosphatase [Gemmatimonadaceae bacterium]NUR20258.1 HAD family phosphatase [Gemmatimonadaceae bacterium]NUS98215.1 HAD family phosphatase [Gemmatimonadaceae bacterium]